MEENKNNTNELENSINHTVEIYSTPTCHYCHLAKDWMNEKEVKYVDYDVTVNTEKAREVVEMTGQRGVPVIKIGNDVIIGFNQAKMEELLDVK
jgi:glutaredoxin 3